MIAFSLGHERAAPLKAFDALSIHKQSARQVGKFGRIAADIAGDGRHRRQRTG
jgi:hypothetical protein